MPQPLRYALLSIAVLGFVGLIVYTFVRSLRRSENPTGLIVRWGITLVVIGWAVYEAIRAQGREQAFLVTHVALPVAALMIIVWGRSLAEILAKPFTAIFEANEELEPQALYSVAEARRRTGRFREAMYEIQAQLQKFPTDYRGQMMLAEIQAENVNDLPGAEVTIRRLCGQPNHKPGEVAAALNTLADWHMKFDQDVDAARAALQEIADRFPNTDLAQTAANRLAHLTSVDALLEAHDRPTLKLKPGVEYLGMVKDQSALMPKEPDFRVEAERLVKHLNEFPADAEAREQLAVIYGEKYGRLDFAAEQLELLIALPSESPRHIARWLNLLADLQVRSTGDTTAAAATIQRIIDRFPNTSFDELARQRLLALNQEVKRYQNSAAVKLKPSP